MIRQRLSILALACAVLLSTSLTGCDSAGSSDEATPEVITPASFTIDLETFPLGDAGTSSSAVAKANGHVGNAAFRVGIVSALIGLNLIIPEAVTAAALQADPVIEDDTWIWESSTQVETGETVSFRLEGTTEGNRVYWTMAISGAGQSGEGESFELYTAETAPNGEEGTWSLYYDIDGERRNVLTADFAVDNDTHKQITFTVAEGAGENVGDSVRYEQDGATRVFVWTQVDPAETVTVEWDAETKEGSIVAPGYNSGEEACWDTNLQNAPCE